MNVRLSNIELKYSYKHVLKGVNVEFCQGGIHALLGENGAGKSSLMKILTGFLKPTSGKIFLDEKEVVFKKPVNSLKYGIACVYQRPFLSNFISVEENLCIGIPFAMKKNLKLEKADLSFPDLTFLDGINIKEKVCNLSGSKRFFVAFTASLLRNPKVLILDEPTALLNEAESKKLFTKLRSLSQKGMNIIVISHKPQDLKYCDDAVKMEDGICSPVTNLKEFTDVYFEDELHDKNYNDPEKKLLTPEKCRELRKDNAAIIPSDRTYLASNPDLTITELVCSGFCSGIYPGVKERFSPAKKQELTQKIINRAGIIIKPEEKVYNLSGGMLQRLILERELYANPKIIYLEDPFQGLDSVSCKRLKNRLKQCEENGSKVVFL